MLANFEQLKARYKGHPVWNALDIFGQHHVIYYARDLNDVVERSPAVLNRARTAQFVRDRRHWCDKCGIMGNILLAYRHNNEPGNVSHTDVFAVTETKFQMLTLDHVLPKSIGGANQYSNYRPMCRKCNGNRGNDIKRVELRHIIHKLDNHLGKSPQQAQSFLSFLAKHHPDMYNDLIAELIAHRRGEDIRTAVCNVSSYFPETLEPIDLSIITL